MSIEAATSILAISMILLFIYANWKGPDAQA
jgi:hypothetical protein